MNRIATVLSIALAAVAFAPRVSAQERIATNDTYNEFPRWKTLVNAFNAKDGGGNRVLADHISMAQDSKNILHAVGGLPASGGGCQVNYVNSDWIDRRANGFSEVYQVSSASSGTQCHDSEVTALSDGTVAVLWVEPQSGGTEDIKWRTRSASGSWGSVSTGITGNAGDAFTKLRTTSRGTAIHMTYVHTNGPSVKLMHVNPTSSWTPTTVSDSATSLATAGGSNIAVDGSGSLYVVYEDVTNMATQYARYRSNTGSGWSASTNIAQDGYSPDVFVDTGNNVHLAYVKGAGVNTGKVYHRPGIGGSDTHVGNSTAATAAFDRVRLVTDTRNRPNVVWSTNADVGYAVKVGSSWTRQETIQEPGRGNLGNGRGTNDWSFGGLDSVIDAFDNVSWIDQTSGLVTGMYEPNLSCEDGCATCGVG